MEYFHSVKEWKYSMVLPRTGLRCWSMRGDLPDAHGGFASLTFMEGSVISAWTFPEGAPSWPANEYLSFSSLCGWYLWPTQVFPTRCLSWTLKDIWEPVPSLMVVLQRHIIFKFIAGSSLGQIFHMWRSSSNNLYSTFIEFRRNAFGFPWQLVGNTLLGYCSIKKSRGIDLEKGTFQLHSTQF